MAVLGVGTCSLEYCQHLHSVFPRICFLFSLSIWESPS